MNRNQQNAFDFPTITNSGSRAATRRPTARRTKPVGEKRNDIIILLNDAYNQRMISSEEYFRARNQVDSIGLSAIDEWQSFLQLRFPQLVKNSIPTTTAVKDAFAAEWEDVCNTTVSYAPRAIVMATLPRSRQSALEFKRTSGDYTLLMHVPHELNREHGIELPFGVIPRLIFLYLSTEIKRVEEPVLHLGINRSEFMRKVGITPRTGKRGNMKTFEQQFKNLLGTLFSAWRSKGTQNHGGLCLHHRTIARDSTLWWDCKNTNRFEAILQLDSDFYNEMKSGGFPVSLDTVRRFSADTLALDIYIWLTYRFATLQTIRILPWPYLFSQFAEGEYSDSPKGMDNFRTKFLTKLKLVLAEYPTANVKTVRGGLQLTPSPTHIRISN